MCKHKWLLNRLNLGTCIRCGKERQFPVEKHRLKAGFMNNRGFREVRANDFKYDPSYFQNGSVYETIGGAND